MGETRATKAHVYHGHVRRAQADHFDFLVAEVLSIKSSSRGIDGGERGDTVRIRGAIIQRDQFVDFVCVRRQIDDLDRTGGDTFERVGIFLNDDRLRRRARRVLAPRIRPGRVTRNVQDE